MRWKEEYKEREQKNKSKTLRVQQLSKMKKKNMRKGGKKKKKQEGKERKKYTVDLELRPSLRSYAESGFPAAAVAVVAFFVVCCWFVDGVAVENGDDDDDGDAADDDRQSGEVNEEKDDVRGEKEEKREDEKRRGKTERQGWMNIPPLRRALDVKPLKNTLIASVCFVGFCVAVFLLLRLSLIYRRC